MKCGDLSYTQVNCMLIQWIIHEVWRSKLYKGEVYVDTVDNSGSVEF